MYTQLHNELFKYIPFLSGAAVKILLIVARQTYGWHKENAQISLQTFEMQSGLSRSSVVRAIAELVKAELLDVKRIKVGDLNEINSYQILLPMQKEVKAIPKIAPSTLSHLQSQTIKNVEKSVSGSQLDTNCPQCGLITNMNEINRYGTCSFCYVKSLTLK